MNLAELQKKLLGAARSNPPSDKVPYAFEKRIMARLASPPAEDVGVFWARALWRGAAACVAVSILSGVWSFASLNGADAAVTFSQDLEQTILASVDDVDEPL